MSSPCSYSGQPFLKLSCQYLQELFGESGQGPLSCEELEDQKQQIISDLVHLNSILGPPCTNDEAEAVYNKLHQCTCSSSLSIVVIIGIILGGLLLLIILIRLYQHFS